MIKFAIRYNKRAGDPNGKWGTKDHGWRVIPEGSVFGGVYKNVKIHVPSWGERVGEDWSICCEGYLLEHEDGTAIISGVDPTQCESG